MSWISSQLEKLVSNDEGCESKLHEDLIFMCHSSEETECISFVNKLLFKNLSKGLECLNLVLRECSSEIIYENALKWINHCIVKHPGDKNLIELRLIIIGKIVNTAYKEQEFTKKFISEHISKVLDMCLPPHMDSYHKDSALKMLTICMKRYGSWFSSHKFEVEPFVIECLDDPKEYIVVKAALAFHYLQQVGGAGVNGVNHSKNFSDSFQKLCATMHHLLDEVLGNETEIEHFSRNEFDPFKFTIPPVDSVTMLGVLSRRIRNCLIFMTKMLTEGFPALKGFNLQEVLGIVRRGTMIHHCLTVASEEKTHYDYGFSSLLNKMQIQLLQLLGSFIKKFRTNFLPYSSLVSKLLTDCLKRTQNCRCFASDCSYQETVYGSLNQWIPITRCSLGPHFKSQLITCILKDITPVKASMSLVKTADTNKNASRKAKRRALEEKIIASGQSDSSNIPDGRQKRIQEKNCSSALSTLWLILTKSNLDNMTDLYKDLLSTVTNTLMEITNSNYLHPYTNIECQTMLYKVLGAFLEQDSLEITSSLSLPLHIFTVGSRRNNEDIASVCGQSLYKLRTLCEPLCPPLYTAEKSVGLSESCEVTDDPDATIGLWCPPDVARHQASDRVSKINIQEVKIFKTSDSMEVEPSSPGVMRFEEQTPTFGHVNDQPEVPSADLTPGGIETETNILREELLSTNEFPVKEMEAFALGSKKSETNYLGLNLKEELLSSSDLGQDDQVSKSKETKTNISEANQLHEDVKSEIVSSSDLGQEAQVSTSGLRDVCVETQEANNLVSSITEPISDRTAAQENECDEPSPKRIRIEELSEEAAVKNELQSYEEIDDEFNEEDSFVDVVREDY